MSKPVLPSIEGDDVSTSKPVLPSIERLATYMALDSVPQFGPQKFREVIDAGLSPGDVVDEPSKLPIGGKRGDSFRSAIADFGKKERDEITRHASLAVERAKENSASIVLVGDAAYPPNLWDSNNPVPILYVQGDLNVLANPRAVACVGSRQIRDPYAARQREFAGHTARSGRVVVSGFALGADSVAHRGAWEAGGATVCVMPCGLDRVFPPENRGLRQELLDYDLAVFVSEFPFATGAASLTLRKRNKTIVALAKGVLVVQSSAKGGAMNAYRFGLEQKKPLATFSGDGTEATSGNRQIAETEGAVAFPDDRPDEDAWEAWLAKL